MNTRRIAARCGGGGGAAAFSPPPAAVLRSPRTDVRSRPATTVLRSRPGSPAAAARVSLTAASCVRPVASRAIGGSKTSLAPWARPAKKEPPQPFMGPVNAALFFGAPASALVAFAYFALGEAK